MGVLEVARRLADEVLFEAALDTDRADVAPRSLFDTLAAAGLYGLAGPAEAGGLEMAWPEPLSIIETLAGGCLTTTFVWLQHHGPLRAVAASATPGLSEEWLGPLCRGEKRAGVAFAGLRRPGPPVLTATAAAGGWVLDGYAPWVTGWGRVDVVHYGARTPDGDVLWCLVDAVETDTTEVERLTLAAINASATVTVRFRGHVVPATRVTAIEPFEEWRSRDEAGLRTNGSLALGVAGRCARLLESSSLSAEVDQCRASLDSAGVAELPPARAAATALAWKAAGRVVAAGGGRSVVVDSHAQRLAREAMFLLVAGQTAAIRQAQLA